MQNSLELEVERVKAAFESVLNKKIDGLDDNFFSLGGDSFDAIRVVSILGVNKKVAIVNLFENPTINSFSKHLIKNYSQEAARFVKLGSSKNDCEVAFIGIPYGGGDPVNYRYLFEGYPTISTYGFDMANQSVSDEEECKQLVHGLVEELRNIRAKQIVIYGHCAGAALASCLATKLTSIRDGVHLVVAAAAPILDPEEKLIDAENTSEKVWESYLRSIGGFDGLTHEEAHSMMEKGRRDHVLSCEAYRLLKKLETRDLNSLAIFGGEDPVTESVSNCLNAWKKLIPVQRFETIQSGGHYFIRTHQQEIESLISTSLLHKINITPKRKEYEASN
ncbi:hypothetical protein AB1F87_003636 [Vibrio mimicus]